MNTEDLLEELASLSDTQNHYSIDKTDISLIRSLGKQVLRGTPLTDRQYDLSKKKIIEYKSQLENNGFSNIESYLKNLRMPLRSIDRSRWIKLVPSPGHSVRYQETGLPWVAVRFSFNKKLISALDNIRLSICENRYFENNIHYFPATEKNIFVLVSNLIEKDFKIDEEVLEYYNQCLDIKQNPEKYIPYIKDYTLYNFPSKLKTNLANRFGLCNSSNLNLYKDRAYRYNYIVNFDIKTECQIQNKILNRSSKLLNFAESKFDINSVVSALSSLKRDPILVIINSLDNITEYDQLQKCYDLFSNYYNNSEQSVLFRLDNSDMSGVKFNQFVRDNNLNNLVDKNTKVVYIKENKLPKPLITSEWSPITLFCLKSYRLGSQVENYFNTYCDLYVSTDDSNHSEYLVRDRRLHGYM